MFVYFFSFLKPFQLFKMVNDDIALIPYFVVFKQPCLLIAAVLFLIIFLNDSFLAIDFKP